MTIQYIVLMNEERKFLSDFKRQRGNQITYKTSFTHNILEALWLTDKVEALGLAQTLDLMAVWVESEIELKTLDGQSIEKEFYL